MGTFVKMQGDDRVNLENRRDRRGRRVAPDGQGLGWQPQLDLGALHLNNFTKEWLWTRPLCG